MCRFRRFLPQNLPQNPNCAALYQADIGTALSQHLSHFINVQPVLEVRLGAGQWAWLVQCEIHMFDS